MSPRLRPKKPIWTATAIGRLTRLASLGERQVSATLALEAAAAETDTLLRRVAEWEMEALLEARRRKRRGAHELQVAARRLRLRPSLCATRPELRLTAPLCALDPTAPRPCEPLEDARVSATFSASPVILPAAGLVTLEFRLMRLAAQSHP